MLERTVKVYCLWKDFSWNIDEVNVLIPVRLSENIQYIEHKAVDLAFEKYEEKPLQIGLLKI